MGPGKRVTVLLRKTIAAIAALLIVFGNIPINSTYIYAFDPDKFCVNSITVFKVYDENRNLEQRKILIMGSYLKDAEVGIVTSTGYYQLGNRTVNSEGLLQFDIDEDQFGSSIVIEGKSIPINEGEMPTLTAVNNRKIRTGIDDLILYGTRLGNVQNPEITAGYEHDGAYTPMLKSAFTDDETVTIPTPTGALGYQNIIFEKTETIEDQAFNPENPSVDVLVTVKYTYREQFKFIQDIVVDGLEMRPNRGTKGETLFLEAPTPNLDNYDVFFIKTIDGTDPYTNSNKGKNKTFLENVDGKDILSVEIPDLPIGEYYVVLTNPITEGHDPMDEVVREKVVGTAPDYERFTIVDASLKSRIISILPNKGPDTGSSVTISGQFFISLNIPEYIPNDSTVTVESPAGDTNSQELLVTYAPGTYNGIPISSARRRIKAFIGGSAQFLTRDDGSVYDVVYSRDLDRIAVKTPQVTDAEENPLKDVVIETETVFTKAPPYSGSIIIKERAELTDGYTYIPSKVEPVIESVVPEKIQVVSKAGGGYEVPEDVMVAVLGQNLMIHKFVQADGTTTVRYPIIEFGTDIGLNKNENQNPGDPPSNPDIALKVFSSDGKELDGTEGHELGAKILVIIPAGSEVDELGKTFLKVTNPVRNSDSSGLSAIKADSVEFVCPDTNKNPIITSVEPSIVTLEGGEQISVKGSNFAAGVRVFIDGSEVKTVNRREDGKEITFTCPKGREGETQLMVMNPEGGMDIWPFVYVETYTNPKITSFSPKSGNTGMLVVIKGENFIKPEPTSSEENIYKLVGSRVMLEGKDVNEYNLDPVTKKIKLRDYKSPENDPILGIGTYESTGGKYLKVADYSRAVLLQDTDPVNPYFYTLDTDAKGRVVLSDGAGNNYIIRLNDEGSGIIADKEGGGVYELEVGEEAGYSTITIHEEIDKVLKLRTLYKVDQYGIITGKRAKVVDINTIYFTIPILEADGYYDVTVINPDTKSDTKKDAEGFYYYGQPQSKPTITAINPDEGSVEGGYSITIYGSDFEDTGATKSRVFINGVEIEPKNITVSIDGKSIVAVVPPYVGDIMEEKGTNRLTVPVVILNSDGGSVSKEEGFTYIVAVSYPKIIKIVPGKGSASGGDVVEITGTDFRYFEPYDDANRNQEKDADEAWNDINANGRWDSESDLGTSYDWSDPRDLEGNPQYEHYYASPILPKVYFGESLAKIVEFARGYIKVITPSAESGRTDVFVVNNDSGISNTVSFTYELSSPKIDKILPSQGKKQGGEKVEIIGSDFQESFIEVLNGTDASGQLTQTNMVLVCFGGITNRDIPREEENSGRIDNGRATVRLEGGLTAEYDAYAGRLNLSIEDRGTYSLGITGYDGSAIYIPVSLLKDGTGSVYPGYELIRVCVTDRRLLVDRGFSPEVESITSRHLIVDTPSYYTVGKVDVFVINPDGGKAVKEFEYKNPASAPGIVNITKENQMPTLETINGISAKILRVSCKGGNIVSIIGQDFRENAEIHISDVAVITKNNITYSLPTKLTFEMPAVDESAVGKTHRVIVINEDGGMAASDALSPPIYIVFVKGESVPAIEKLVPDRGSSNGGIRIKIEGSDFRETMEGFSGRLSVYFGETKVADDDVTVADYKTIYVNVPPGVPGQVEVKVENPDGELSDPSGTFTYLSSPSITSVVDPADPSEDAQITVISVEGNQEIKIKGSGFAEGARVVFIPEIAKLEDNEENDKTIFIDGQPYALESGIEGREVKFIDSETLTVVTPQGKMNSKGIMVINEDGGATDIFNNLKYGLPELAAPTGVTAELVFDRYIKIYWNSINGAREYEVYAVIDGSGMDLVGSTKLTSFLYEDLEPKTSYKFIIKAVGDFGASPPSEESNTVRTGSKAGPPDDDGSLNEKTKVERKADTASIVLGEKDADDGDLTFDLTRGELAGSKNTIVSIPVSVVTSAHAGSISIIGMDFSLRFSPHVFDVSRVRKYKDREDAGIRFAITQYNGSVELKNPQISPIPLSPKYKLEAWLFVGKDSTSMDLLDCAMTLTLDFDKAKADKRRISKISVDCYDGYENGWEPAGYAVPGDHAVSADIERLGIYVVNGRK